MRSLLALFSLLAAGGEYNTAFAWPNLMFVLLFGALVLPVVKRLEAEK